MCVQLCSQWNVLLSAKEITICVGSPRAPFCVVGQGRRPTTRLKRHASDCKAKTLLRCMDVCMHHGVHIALHNTAPHTPNAKCCCTIKLLQVSGNLHVPIKRLAMLHSKLCAKHAVQSNPPEVQVLHLLPRRAH